MKKLLILFITIFLISCGGNNEEQPAKKKEYEFLKSPSTSSHSVETPTSSVVENVSYWFILVEDKDGSGIKYNKFIKQNHSYFSYGEAKAEFSVDVFIINFIRIDKETYEKN